jgi:Txe/YoeB family toxin of toxin-antitoxin system
MRNIEFTDKGWEDFIVLKGYWSRRITEEHRLVYAVSDTAIKIVSCKYHYKKC